MGKALLTRGTSSSSPTGNYLPVGGFGAGNSAEAESQIRAPVDMRLSALRTHIFFGTGSGTNTLRMRVNGADGNLVASRSSSGVASDLVNSDDLTAGDLIALAATDTGSNPRHAYTSVVMELDAGHGCLHITSHSTPQVYDVASSTRYERIAGSLTADGVATEASVQHLVRGYTKWTHIQVVVTSNARTNDSTISARVNGADVGVAITIGAGLTGIFTASFNVALSPGDLINYSITLGSGTQDLVISAFGALLESDALTSEVVAMGGVSRAASAAATLYNFGGALVENSLPSAPLGFPARLRNFRCFVAANTYTDTATILMRINSMVVMSIAVSAGVTGWVENTVDTYDLIGVSVATATASFGIVDGSSGSITVNDISIDLEEIISGSLSATESQDQAAFDGVVEIYGQMDATETADQAGIAGAVPVVGEMTAVEAADTASFSGVVPFFATMSAAESPDGASFAGIVPVFGEMAATEAADGLSGSGSTPYPPITSALQRTAPGPYIVMYQLDLTALGGQVLYFTAGTYQDPATGTISEISFDGNEYVPLPIIATGFEKSSKGPLARPRLQIGNVTNLVTQLLRDHQGLLGAKLTRIRTLAQYLDTGPSPDPTQVLPPETYIISRKVQHNKVFVEFELRAAIDLEGVVCPKRVLLRQCAARYRARSGSSFVYDTSDMACPYTDNRYFNDQDAMVTNPADDKCSQTLIGCKARFGENSALPFMGFPSAAKARG